MFGDEVAARQLLTDLAFIDDREHQLSDELDVLRARGASTASGVGGAFNQRTGLRATDNEIGSVYANIAFRMGYLRTERILTATEFASLESSGWVSCLHQLFGLPTRCSSWSSARLYCDH